MHAVSKVLLSEQAGRSLVPSDYPDIVGSQVISNQSRSGRRALHSLTTCSCDSSWHAGISSQSTCAMGRALSGLDPLAVSLRATESVRACLVWSKAASP